MADVHACNAKGDLFRWSSAWRDLVCIGHGIAGIYCDQYVSDDNWKTLLCYPDEQVIINIQNKAVIYTHTHAHNRCTSDGKPGCMVNSEISPKLGREPVTFYL